MTGKRTTDVAEAATSNGRWQILHESRHGITLERSGVIMASRRAYGYDAGARWVEVFLTEEQNVASSGDWIRVCTVSRELDLVTDALRPATVNWSAWGAQTPAITLLVARALNLAARLAQHLDDGGDITRAEANRELPLGR